MAVATVTALAAALPACRSSNSAVSTDPSQRIYRNAAVDFTKLKGINLTFGSVTTSNNEGVDLTKQVFTDSLKQHLTAKFGPIGEGATAPPDGALLEVALNVNWGSRTARAMVGWGAGRAGIEMKFFLKDPSGKLMAKLDWADTMSGGAWGGDARALVFSAADKWANYFANTVLVNAPAGS